MSRSRGKIVWPIVIISLVVLLSGLNKPHLSPFATKVDFDNLSSLYVGETRIVAVDSEQERMLIADRGCRLIKILDMSLSGGAMDRITDVSIFGDRIYVTGCTLFNSGNYLSSELISTYNLDGVYLETIYQRKYVPEDFVTRKHIISSTAEADTFYIVSANGKECCLQMKCGGGPFDTVYSFEVMENVCKAQYVRSTDEITILGMSGNKYVKAGDGEVAGPFNEKEPTVDVSDCTYDHFNCSTTFVICNIAFWLSVLVVVMFFIVILIRYAAGHFGTGIGSLGIALLAILISVGFYSYKSIEQMKLQYEQNIKIQTRQLTYVFSDLLRDWDAETWNDNPEGFFRDSRNWPLNEKSDDVVRNLCNAHGTEYSIYSKIMLITRDNNIYTFVDSRNSQPAGCLMGNLDEVKEHLDMEETGLWKHVLNEAKVLYYWSYINDANGNPIGVVITGCNQANMRKSQVDIAVSMLVLLAAVFIILFIGVSVYKDYSKDVRRFISRDRRQSRERQVDMCGLFMFICTMAAFMDSVIVVFIVQKMCEGMSEAALSARIAIPMAMMSAGSFLGSLGFRKFRSMVGDRKLSFWSCLLGTMAMVVAVVSIRISSLELYSVAKFIIGFFISGVMYSMCNVMPFAADDDQAVGKAVDHTRSAILAATIISVSVGGFISEYVSNTMIYIVTAVITIVMMVLSVMVFENKSKSVREDKTDAPVRNVWSMFLKGPSISFVFLIVLPMVVASGYRTFMFPLFAANCGMSVLLLSNMQVFTKTFCYMFRSEISSFIGSKNQARLLCLSLLTVGVSMLCFIFNTNILWAVIVLFVVELGQRVFNTSSVMFVRDVAKEYKHDVSDAVAEYRVIENASYIVHSPIISGFMAWGYSLGCILLGAVCGVFSGIFALVNRYRFK